MRFERWFARVILLIALTGTAAVLALAQTVSITITPDIIALESPFQIVVDGLSSETDYTVTLTLAETGEVVYTTVETANGDGQILMMMASEPDDATGLYEISVRDGEQVIATGQFTLVDDTPDIPPPDVPERNTRNVTIMPLTGPIGATHDVLVTGLEADQTVSIEIIQASTGDIVYERSRSADGIGQVQFEIFSSGDDAPGTYIVVVRSGGDAIGRGEFVVEAPPVIDAQITVLPPSAPAGTNFYIDVAQMPPFTNFTVDVVDEDNSVVFSRIARTDVNGEATVEFESEPDIVLGDYAVRAMLDEAEIGLSELSITDGEAQAAQVVITPSSGDIGTMHNINVIGLESDSAFTLEIVQDSSDEVIYSTERSTDDSGRFFMNIASEEGDAPGLYHINTVQDGIVTATGSFTIEGDAEVMQAPDEQPPAETTPEPSSAAISVEPETGPRGSAHSITATGLEPDARYTVAISLLENVIYSVERTADASGQITVDVRSEATDTMGVYTVSVAQEDEVLAEASLIISRDSDTQQSPTLTIEPSSAPQGSSHVITVSGLQPGSQLSLSVSQDEEVVYSTDRSADLNGQAVVYLRSDESDLPGDYSVTAQQDGELIAEGTLTIEAVAVSPPATEEPDSEQVISISIDPSQGPIGTSHSVTITGLEPESSVQVEVSYAGEVVYSTERSTSADGIVSLTLASEPGDPSGTYTLTVSSDGTTLASAEMVVEDVDTSSPDEAAGDAEGQAEVLLAEDGTLTEDEPEMRYSFQGQAGQVVDISTSSSDFDTLVILEDMNGEQLARNDDYEGQRDARIVGYELPDSGTYTVVVTSFEQNILGQAAIGSFSLTVETTASAPATSDLSADTSPASGPIGTTHVVTAEGLEPGETVTLTVTFDDAQVFTTQAVADPDGSISVSLVSEDGDASGIYEIIITRASGDEVARTQFEITDEAAITPPDTDERPDGDAILSTDGELTLDMLTQIYSFQGEIDEVVTITLDSDAFDPLVILLDENGSELFRDDDSGTDYNSAISRYTLPYSGIYYVVVSSYDRVSQGGFSLNVTQAGQLPAVSAAVTVAPASGPPGTLHYVNITGLQSSQTVTVNVLYDEQVVFTTEHEADSNGIITVQLTSDEGDEEGIYTIEVVDEDNTLITSTQFSVSTDDSAAQSGVLLTISDALTADSLSRAYSFAGEADQQIEISLTSDAFDTVVILQDEDNIELTRNDDDGISLNSFISVYTLPYTGTYTIIVSSYSETSTGPFELTVRMAQMDALTYDLPVRGAFDTSNWSDVYSFEGEADSLIMFDVQAAANMSLSLKYAEDNSTVSSYLEPGTPVRLPSSGRYLVEVMSYDITESMMGTISYTLSVAEIVARELPPDTAVMVDFSADDSYEYFMLEGVAGDQFSLSVSSDSQFDTTLTLIAPDNHTEFFDDDSGPAYNPEINGHVLSQTGTYLLVLQTYSPGDSGSVTLELSSTSAQSLTSAIQRIQLNSKHTRAGFSIEGSSGDVITLNINRISGMAADLHITVQQGEETLMAYEGVGSPDMFNLSFSLRDDSPVSISLEDAGYGNSVLEISAQRD